MQQAKLTIINLAHITTHLLFAAICIMAWQIITQQHRLDGLVLSVGLLGSLLPDLDTSSSFAGRVLLPLSRFLEERFGHRQEIHTLWFPAALWIVSLIWPHTSWAIYAQAVAIGYLSHLLLDTLNSEGVAFLLPLSKARALLLGGIVKRQQASETILLVILVAGVALMAVFARFEPSEFVQNLLPNIDTAREQYRTWEGIYHVYAHVEGIWNDTHQRYYGESEVMGFDQGGALLLRDLETNRTFTAGRHPIDDLYVSKITLRKGEPITTSPQQPADEPAPPPIATPTPVLVTILIEGVRDPLLEIVVRPGDHITRGQLIAELFPPVTPVPPQVANTQTVTDALQALQIALAKAELDTAQAEYKRALEGQAPSEASILQAEAALVQIEASIASLQYLQAANPALSYVPAQISAAQARLKAAEARLEEIEKWQGPSAGDVAVAKAKLEEAKLRYDMAVLPPTPRPTATAEATPSPKQVYSMVNGLVRDIHVSRVVGNVATMEIAVELGP